MKHTPLLTSLALLATAAYAQETPTPIPAQELPKSALCLVCAANGEGEEKPAAGMRYKNRTYYFCNKKEVEEFKKNPEAMIPLPLPRPLPATASFTALSGEPATLGQYAGKVLLVDFWATWCKPCLEAMPDLQKLHDTYSARGLRVVGVSLDEKGASVVTPFLAKRKFTYPMLLDGGKSPAWQQFGVKGIPALFLIDQNGQIVRQWTGKPDKKQVEQAVLALLDAGKEVK